MANIINTRIVLRNDDLSNWVNSTRPLLKGEIALAKREDSSYDLRVGDGSSIWSQLSNSFALSADQIIGLNTISTDFSNEINNIKNIINSTDLSSLSDKSDDAGKVASKQYVQDQVASIGDVLHFKGIITLSEGQTVEEAVIAAGIYKEGESAIKGDIVLDSTYGIEYVFVDQYNDQSNVWIKIGDEKNHVTKSEFQSEIDERIAVDTTLSTAIDNKVWINGISADTLSVINISQNDYHTLVVDKKLDSKTVYIVSSDTEYNMYGQKIVGLAEGTEISDAVTYGQISSLSNTIMTEVEKNALSSVTIGDTAYKIDDNKNITLAISAIYGGDSQLI